MSRAPGLSAPLWLALLLAVLFQQVETRILCTTREHTDISRQRTFYQQFGREVDPSKDECHATVCHAGLPPSANWTLFGFGLTFADELTAVRVEGCHVECLQRHDDSSVPGARTRNLYAVSCEGNPKLYQCLGACLYGVCNTSLSGPGAADTCDRGLMEIDQLCNSSISASGSGYSGPAFNYNFHQSSRPPQTGSFTLEQPESPAQVVARRYGLMTFNFSGILDKSVLYPGLVGVVWRLEPLENKISMFVPQHAVYRYLKDQLPEEDVRSAHLFTVPELQCKHVVVSFSMVNTSHRTGWREFAFSQCLIGRLYPDPPQDLTLCFYNETNRMPGLEVAFHLRARPDDSNVEGYGVIVSGRRLKMLESNAFLKATCEGLSANKTKILAKFPGSEDGVIVASGSAVPWEVLWGCFETVEVKYFSLPAPPKDTGVEARYTAYEFDVPGTGRVGQTFFPPYSSECSDSLQLVNESVQLNDTCSLDAVVTYSLTVSNASVVFLQELKVDFYTGTNLPAVVITKEDGVVVMSEASIDTDVHSHPSPNGFVVVIQHQARGIHLAQDVEVKSKVTFEYNREFRRYYKMATVDLRERIPPSSIPLLVDNITKLDHDRFTGERVEVEFEWESPGTLCYPVLEYFITVRSPQMEETHSETFETNATLSGQVVHYTLRTSAYRAGHYNLTVRAMFGNGNFTDPSTLPFTLDLDFSEQPGVDGRGVGTGLPPFGYGIIGGVLGVVIVVLAVILVVAVVATCWYRRRNVRAVTGKKVTVAFSNTSKADE